MNRGIFKSLSLISILLAVFVVMLLTVIQKAEVAPSGWFELQVVDADTGRGIPMVELKTTDSRIFVTDSAGRLALDELYMMNQVVFFEVFANGYDQPAPDFIGTRGLRPRVVSGGEAVFKLKRLNIAERLYRFTGADIYTDTYFLEKPVPIKKAYDDSGVLYHDAIYKWYSDIYEPVLDAQPVVYKGKVFWFFGATQGTLLSRRNLKVTVATSELPSSGGLDPDSGVDLEYFLGDDGFVKPMFPFGEKDDIVWVEGAVVVPDKEGRERLAAYYKIMRDWEMVEHGLALFNDEKEVFEKYAVFGRNESWRVPRGRALRFTADGKEWIYFGKAFPNVRVPADLDSLCNPSAYQALSCFADSGPVDMRDEVNLLRDEEGKPVYRWSSEVPPVGPAEESELLMYGHIYEDETYFSPVDVDSPYGQQVVLNSGSVSWNPWRQKWIFIGVEEYGSPSRFGEIWYSEADSPTGPWLKAKKIASHQRDSFVNPIHLSFLDREDGKVIYFEGLYTNSFSDNKEPMMLYNNNRLMYKLDLSDSRLEAVR